MPTQQTGHSYDSVDVVTVRYAKTFAMASCAKSEGGSDGSGGLRKCAPCEGGDASGLKLLSKTELDQELASLPLWTNASSESGDRIVRSFAAKNFVSAMAFLNDVAKIAQEQGHHPDLHLTSYRDVEIQLQTFSMGGVTQNDIIEARLFDQIPVEYSPKWLREHPEATTAASTA